MSCIKTGCTVLVQGKYYHGDLFVGPGGFELRGVPPGGCAYEPNGLHHCEAEFIELMHYSDFRGNVEYSTFFLGNVTATEKFYQYIQQWEPAAARYFKVVDNG